jgi:hypothetical protein
MSACAQGRPANAVATAAESPKYVVYFLIPVMTAAISTYSTVQIIRLAIIPIGMSRCGFFVSSAVVETASNPMNAKKTMAAPLIMPPTPLGRNGCQLVGRTMNAPNAITKTTTATLVTTMAVLVRALSRIP